MARWIERLQEYDYDVEHRAGVNHRNADALSRRPCAADCRHCARHEDKLCRTTVTDEQWEPREIRKDQENDPDLKLILNWKITDRRPTWEEVAKYGPKLKSYWAQWESLEVEDGVPLGKRLRSMDRS